VQFRGSQDCSESEETAKTVAAVYKSAMAARKDKTPSRNASRDREVFKQVVDSLNALDLRTPSGPAEIWKNKYFMEYKVGLMHVTPSMYSVQRVYNKRTIIWLVSAVEQARRSVVRPTHAITFSRSY